jgi:hypothetical protein
MAIINGETGGIKVHLSDLVEAFCHQFREYDEEELKRLVKWKRRVWVGPDARR